MLPLELWLSLAGLPVAFFLEPDLALSPRLRRFALPPAGEPAARISVRLWRRDPPAPAAAPCGRDLLLEYFRDDGGLLAVAPGRLGPVMLTRCDAACRDITAFLNTAAYPGVFRTLDKVLQLMPLRQLLLSRGALLLHASMVNFRGAGILFSAASGVGKSTQARLWAAHAGAALCCNDRAVLRVVGGAWQAFGYPNDGSDPVSGPESAGPVSALVLLAQGPENRAAPVSPRAALRPLAEQTVMDAWNPDFRTGATLLLAGLLSACPVYRLACRPDAGAVTCLMDQLRKDGVL